MGEPLVVGRIGRAHGIRGDVFVAVRTDVPDVRFAVGAVLDREPVGDGPLVVASSRWHSGKLVVRFEGVDSRTVAETLSGTTLTVDSADLGDAGDGAWWDHDLVGLTVVTVAGEAVGAVADVLHTPAGDLLSVRRSEGGEILVPFVEAIVPEVDVPGGRLVLDPPDGLMELGS